MFAVSGILFNHESPRRGAEFVTRKVTARRGADRASGSSASSSSATSTPAATGASPATTCARCGLMLQRDEPQDFVIATGRTHSVRELCETAFGAVGLDWREHVRTDPSCCDLRRSTTSSATRARAREPLRWSPTTSFEELIEHMVAHELDLARKS